jgi:hypothetical protein
VEQPKNKKQGEIPMLKGTQKGQSKLRKEITKCGKKKEAMAA